jgi:hypothetical protein
LTAAAFLERRDFVRVQFPPFAWFQLPAIADRPERAFAQCLHRMADGFAHTRT